MEEAMNTQRLPQTDSIQELARFWDTHDLTDFEDELEEVSEPIFERATVITLHLQSHEAEAIREMAKSKGLADAELIREWVLEKIHAT
jgi:predicted DNA binding CopG/RHH family protein